MSKLLYRIQQSEGFAAIGPVDDSKISEAEMKLNLSFAEDYKEYVQTFGAATFSARELTGICSGGPQDVVLATKRAREFFPKFPTDAYVIEEMLIDHVMMIQNGEGSIFCYGPHDSGEEVASGLTEYLFSNQLGNEVR